MFTIPICNKLLELYGDSECETPPTIEGLTDLTVEVGEEFDPLEGVTAYDCNGSSVEVTVTKGE